MTKKPEIYVDRLFKRYFPELSLDPMLVERVQKGGSGSVEIILELRETWDIKGVIVRSGKHHLKIMLCKNLDSLFAVQLNGFWYFYGLPL